ncbi:MAG: EamA family transporter [Thermoproteota archaeon]
MRWLGFALIAMFFWGIAPILGKIGLTYTDPLLGLSVRTFGIAAVLLIIGIFTGGISQLADIDFRSSLFLLGEGIFAGLIGHFAYFYSLKLGNTSKVVPIVMAYPLISVTLGILLLNESISLLKAGGILLTISGIILLSL